MEIKLKNLSCEALEKINLVLKEKKMIAVTGEEKEHLLKAIALKEQTTGTIYIDGTRITQKNKMLYYSRIYLVENHFDYKIPVSTVGEYFHYIMQKFHLSIQNEEKKIKGALHLIGLQEGIMHRSLLALSTTEKKLIRIGEALLINPDFLLFEYPFENLDYKNIKRLMRIFSKLKDKYHKTIIFITDNCEEIYQYADEVIILKEKNILLEGSPLEVYKNKELLEKENIPIPQFILFSNYVQEKKKVHLDYYKDIRDLIKDIYRKI